MFYPIAVGIMCLGGLALLVGVVVANIAVVEMAERLNSKYQYGRQRRWWQVIGHGAQLVMSEYRELAWQDASPENRLRFGYWLIAIGLATLAAGSLLGKYFRGRS